MIESIRLIEDRLISNVQTTHYRYLYSQFSIDQRLTGLVGARGVGKTTLMLQYLKNHPDIRAKGIYFSADHIYFSQTTLYEFIEHLYLTNDTQYFFIDEIHKYANWNQEIKNLYDGFPSIKIIFSGSSSLDLVRGSYDLSRRSILMRLPGLSFREYINFSLQLAIQSITYDELLNNKHALHDELSQVKRLKGVFQDYLQLGYYPFSIDDPVHFEERLLRVVEKTVFEDIANFYHLKTENLPILKKILTFLASFPPGKVSTHNIAKNLSINDRTVTGYLKMLQETDLIQMIYTNESGNATLRKPEKVFLNNTNLQIALQQEAGLVKEIGTIRELFFIQSMAGINNKPSYSKVGDYKFGDNIFEIGGPNKTRKQVKGKTNAFVVKDSLISTSKNEIPLMYFGFLY